MIRRPLARLLMAVADESYRVADRLNPVEASVPFDLPS
jgi:hypothetical protein